MRILGLGMALWLGFVGTTLAQDPKKELPPQMGTKLMRLESQVSEIERKWFRIERMIQRLGSKIFGKDKDASFNEPKGRNVVTIYHNNQMGGVFRIMEVDYILVHKGQRRSLFKAKRANITDAMTDRVKVHQRVLSPGDYVLDVVARVHGYSPMFTYLNSYRLKLNNSMRFRVKAGRPLLIRVVFRDLGGLKIQERLKIIFKTVR